MPRKKYRFNPDTLTYEELRQSPLMKLFRIALWIAPNLILALVIAYFVTRKIDSPREHALKAELDAYQVELARMNKDLVLINDVLNDIERRDEEMYRLALHAKSFPETYRRMGVGGSERYDHLRQLTNTELLIETATKIDKLERRLHAQSLSFKELLDLARNKEKMLASVPAIQPIRNKDLKSAISGFGYRVDPIYKTRQMHSGIDFNAKIGTDIYATGDGLVVAIENNHWGYGKSIVIDHGFGYHTRYAHLSSFKVRNGQKVRRGELIGLVGNTGKSTGPHLHYEVIKDGNAVNPIGYFHQDLSPDQYEEMLMRSANSYQSLD